MSHQSLRRSLRHLQQLKNKLIQIRKNGSPFYKELPFLITKIAKPKMFYYTNHNTIPLRQEG